MNVIFDFAMKNDDDAKVRLEYNMGADRLAYWETETVDGVEAVVSNEDNESRI